MDVDKILYTHDCCNEILAIILILKHTKVASSRDAMKMAMFYINGSALDCPEYD